MHWSRFWLALVIALLLASCGGAQEEPRATPTPFSAVGVTLRAPVGDPIALSLSNLAANPALFEGAILQLRGEYKPLPRLICEQEPFPSPATWALLGEGLQANATGLDSQLRQLVEVGQVITVEGRWLRYSGPVGCGKDAPVQEIWYLSANRVVDPNPLARGGAPVTPTVETVSSPTPLPTEQATEAVTETPTWTPTASPEATMTEEAPTYVPSPTGPAGGGTPQRASPTPVPSPLTGTPGGPTATPGTGTPTLTATATGSETPTPEGGTQTATATATATGGTVVEKGSVELEDLVISRLESGNTDSRTVSVASSTALTITVAPATNADISLTVLDPNGQAIIQGHNEAGAGQVETITDVEATQSGAYRIQISSDATSATEYALMVMDSDSYSFAFMGTLGMGAQRGASLTADNDHFWFFTANDGESIDLLVTPNGDEDPYVELYGTNGSLLETIDQNGGGEAEELSNHSILATGMYSVRVGEYDFEPMGYLIIVDNS